MNQPLLDEPQKHFCFMCGGPGITKHHLVPQEIVAKHGIRPMGTIRLCQGCHASIHWHFSNAELAVHFNDPELLKAEFAKREPIRWLKVGVSKFIQSPSRFKKEDGADEEDQPEEFSMPAPDENFCLGGVWFKWREMDLKQKQRKCVAKMRILSADGDAWGEKLWNQRLIKTVA